MRDTPSVWKLSGTPGTTRYRYLVQPNPESPPCTSEHPGPRARQTCTLRETYRLNYWRTRAAGSGSAAIPTGTGYGGFHVPFSPTMALHLCAYS